jgi:hypothetical protein
VAQVHVVVPLASVAELVDSRASPVSISSKQIAVACALEVFKVKSTVTSYRVDVLKPVK